MVHDLNWQTTMSIMCWNQLYNNRRITFVLIAKNKIKNECIKQPLIIKIYNMQLMNVTVFSITSIVCNQIKQTNNHFICHLVNLLTNRAPRYAFKYGWNGWNGIMALSEEHHKKPLTTMQAVRQNPLATNSERPFSHL